MAHRTVHLVLNAHLDPVWLWPWTAGVDEALNTCASMCNLLDRHPDAIFTRGESWIYEQVRRHDPATFRRILGHVRAGRWAPVGGWYLQPDCNLPGIEGFEKQIELGRAWFEEHLGIFPRVAYNVDSFGHSAALPALMRAHGQRSYVFMRPMPNERRLPARMFRWRGHAGGPEVTAFRIAHTYTTQTPPTLEFVQSSLEDLPPGVNHTMCFMGVGDHGGGPSDELIRWCRAHRNAIPGVTMKFSSPARFFRAIAPQVRRLPLHTGEIQQHAIGCYSVLRPIKLGVRRAENFLAQARRALAGATAAARKAASPKLEEAWKQVCFTHFHDTFGGSCTATANRSSEDRIAAACFAAERILSETFRRRAHALPPDPRQRFAIANYAGVPFSGWVEHEPWLEWTKWQPDWCLIDERGRVVPHQLVEAEPVMPDFPRLLFPLTIAAGATRVVRMARRPKGELPGAAGEEGDKPDFKLLPRLELVVDETDTWSHGTPRADGRPLSYEYTGPIAARPLWKKPVQVEAGPIRWAWRVAGWIGQSPVCADWRRYRGADFWELRLRVGWREHHRLLRLTWSPGRAIAGRNDGIPGGGIDRPGNRQELPVRDRSLLRLAGGRTAGAVFPEVYSLSCDREALRLTLLRSCVLAHSLPVVLPPESQLPQMNWSDQGDHVFTLRFFPPGRVTAAALDRHARVLQQRPQVADLTRGMPFRPYIGQLDRPL